MIVTDSTTSATANHCFKASNYGSTFSETYADLEGFYNTITNDRAVKIDRILISELEAYSWMEESEKGETIKPEFRAMTPRFVVKDFDTAIEHYSKIGFQVNYRGEGFMILGRDAVEIQMNEDVDQVRGSSICYMTVNGIEAIYKEINSKIPVDPCNGRHYAVHKQPYGVKEFALYDPFGNLLFFSEPTD